MSVAKKKYSLHLYLFCVMINISLAQQQQKNVNFIVWKRKPYFIEQQTKTVGIIPLIVQKFQTFCDVENVTYVDLKSRENFDRVIRSDVQYGEKELENATSGNVIWGPYTKDIRKYGPGGILKRNVWITVMLSSQNFAVVQPKYRISLPNKILYGMLDCAEIVVMWLIIAILFGIVFWFIEFQKNVLLEKKFMKGAGTGLYWSIVTVTTVGYGDITPATTPGRFLSYVWMLLGIVGASILTATLTMSVTGTHNLQIKYKKVAVIRDSYAEQMICDNYNAEVLQYDTYAEVFQAVRNEEAFAAVVMSQVAAWYEDEIIDDNIKNPLRIVYILPGEVPINFIWDKQSAVIKDLFQCIFHEFRSEIVDWSEKPYRREVKVETISYDGFEYLLKENTVVQVLLGLTIFLILCGIVFDVVSHRRIEDNNKIT